MNRTIDTRILAVGLLLGVALLVRPYGAANASYDTTPTGSVPAVHSVGESR